MRLTALRNPTRHTAVSALALTVALVVAAVACGDDDDASAPPGAPATTHVDHTEGDDGPTTTAKAAGTVDVVAVDYHFEGLPGRVPVGTKLTLANEAQRELHELVAFRIPDAETRSVDDLMALPEDQLEAAVVTGPPAMVLLAPPDGQQINAVGDGTLGEAGRYLLLCAIPTGVDPQVYLSAAAAGGDGPPEIPGAGPPHLVHGMYAELLVE